MVTFSASTPDTTRAIMDIEDAMDDYGCLIVVDLQNDFLEGGALAVPDADPEFVADITAFTDLFDWVVVTQDWHPADHPSFKPYGGPWPVHCVAGTEGAMVPKQFADKLLGLPFVVVHKGTGRDDGYNAAPGRVVLSELTLVEWLQHNQIDVVHMVGLALDHCVKATAAGLTQAGVRTVVHIDGTRAIQDMNQLSLGDLLADGVVATFTPLRDLLADGKDLT